jgi:hypothetical protein
MNSNNTNNAVAVAVADATCVYLCMYSGKNTAVVTFYTWLRALLLLYVSVTKRKAPYIYICFLIVEITAVMNI